MDDDPETTLAGQQIGRYRVDQQIGRGGMGVVYLAQDSRLQRRVALKVLPAEFIRNKDRLHRFEQEEIELRPTTWAFHAFGSFKMVSAPIR